MAKVPTGGDMGYLLLRNQMLLATLIIGASVVHAAAPTLTIESPRGGEVYALW